MGSVTCFAVVGLELWFNSDDHRPPHFHAEKTGEWEVRVYFLRDRAEMFDSKWAARKGGPSRGDRKRIATLVEENRAALLAEWEQKVNVKAPGGAR